MTARRPSRQTADAAAARGQLLFLGVSTSGSSILELFPTWAEILGLHAGIEGRNIPLGAPPERFRRAVGEIAEDEDVAGALVTSHKVSVYEHGAELFDELDRYAHLCREVSCISKREGRLVGHAKDPLTAGMAMDRMLGHDYWRDRHADVLCMGAGGAGTAITVRLLSEARRPRRIVVTDVEASRIDALDAVCRELGGSGAELLVVSGTADADQLLEALPPESLVVNATGMGKDLPGSPVSDRAVFPRGAVVWDLNYRGDLAFLDQAWRQERELRVHDGWQYFLHGWTEVIAEVYHLEMSGDLFARLAASAEPFRPRPSRTGLA